MSAVMEKKPKAKKKMAPIAQPVTIAGNVQMLAVTQLTRHPDNRQPSEAAIAAVAESLRTEGQIEPLIVRPLSGESQSYQIVSGETRWLAAQRLGWDSIACDVVALDDAAALRVLAAANAARQDLDPLAKARLIVRLCDPIESGGSGLTREQAAKMFDLQSGGAASNLVRLLELPEAWHGPIERGDLPQSFARALLPLLALGAESPAWGATFEEWDNRVVKICVGEQIAGIVFRVAEMDGNVCQRSIWCRVEKRDDDWLVSLYRHEREARGDWQRMTAIPEDLLHLAIRAIDHAKGWLERKGGE